MSCCPRACYSTAPYYVEPWSDALVLYDRELGVTTYTTAAYTVSHSVSLLVCAVIRSLVVSVTDTTDALLSVLPVMVHPHVNSSIQCCSASHSVFPVAAVYATTETCQLGDTRNMTASGSMCVSLSRIVTLSYSTTTTALYTLTVVSYPL